jgi:hypothetical protein
MPTSDLVFTVVMLTLFLIGCTILALVARAMVLSERRKRSDHADKGTDDTPGNPPAG